MEKKMNMKEALIALSTQGAKITHISFGKGKYIYLDKCGNIKNQDGEFSAIVNVQSCLGANGSCDNGWRIYRERLAFDDIVIGNNYSVIFEGNKKDLVIVYKSGNLIVGRFLEDSKEVVIYKSSKVPRYHISNFNVSNLELINS